MPRRLDSWRSPLVAGRPRSVLVVDDIPAVRRSVSLLLSAAGYRVFEASDGAEALDVLQAASDLARGRMRPEAGPVDLVLTDVMMPFGGVALVQEIRARWPGQRLLYMSAYPAETILAEGMRTLDAPFLSKPFKPDELLGKLWEAFQTPAPGRATPPDGSARPSSTPRGTEAPKSGDRDPPA